MINAAPKAKALKEAKAKECALLSKLSVELILIIISEPESISSLVRFFATCKQLQSIFMNDSIKSILMKSMLKSHFSLSFLKPNSLTPFNCFRMHYSLQNYNPNLSEEWLDLGDNGGFGWLNCPMFLTAHSYTNLIYAPAFRTLTINSEGVLSETVDKAENVPPNDSPIVIDAGDPLNSKCINVFQTSMEKDLLAVWPLDSARLAYLVAHDHNLVCWISQANRREINVAQVSSSATISPQIILRHSETIGLILSNGKKTLLAFDDFSMIYFWCLETFTLKSKLDTLPILNMIISMNVTGDLLVAGGDNGRIAIWHIPTNLLQAVIPPHSSYDPTIPGSGIALNVAVYGSTVVYGMKSGLHVVYDYIKGETMHELDILREQEHVSVVDGALKREPPRRLLDGSEYAETVRNSLQPAGVLPLMVIGKNGVSLNVEDDEDSTSSFAESESNVYEGFDLDELEVDEYRSDVLFETSSSENEDPTQVQPPQQHQHHHHQHLLVQEPLSIIIPRTLCINSHILITNSPPSYSSLPDDIHDLPTGRASVWDYRTGAHLYYLSEKVPMAGIHVEDFVYDMPLIEMSRDSSVMYTSCVVEEDADGEAVCLRLCVWDWKGCLGSSNEYEGCRVERKFLSSGNENGYFVWEVIRGTS